MGTTSRATLWAIAPFVAALAAVGGNAAAEDKPFKAWGRELFVTYCASCHGEGGGGNGPAANSLKTAPSDLTFISKTHDGVYPREWVSGFIDGSHKLGSHGMREMPVWGAVFAANGAFGRAGAQAAIYALTEYIETIQKP